MKKLIALGLLVLSHAIWAAGGAAVPLDHWDRNKARDLASLQNGAKLFANYCLGCHAAAAMRWNRLRDIGLSEEQIEDFLLPPGQRVGDLITIAMRPADAKQWFGKTPPDLSVIERARTSFDYAGVDYLYTLLRGYYRDASNPTGWNNLVYPNIGMPHILWERQGPRQVSIERVAEESIKSDAKEEKRMVRTVSTYDADGYATVTHEVLSGHPAARVEISTQPADPARARQFDAEVGDLVAYLHYMTEPARDSRVRIGVWVLLAIGVFTVLAWRLNAVYWKDVK
jgi:ubiquinol-cytochrome c reductase cytochrome c1 subunit